ncbi:MAG TPA: alpha/beta hydrolase [Actinomycetes bacterium]|nr:alpha/beta hydrolase [Actinomycetes bacterium]
MADGVPVFYVEKGKGMPVLALHGAGVDHREVMAFLEPVFDGLSAYRRIYPDLPGMGRTPAPETISSADDVLDVLLAFVDGVVGDRPLLVVGHSAGGYYAKAVARRLPDRVVGLALLCPLLPGIRDVPARDVVFGSPDLGDAEFHDYFTVRTAAMLGRHERFVAPAALLADQSAMERIGERWELAAGPEDSVPSPGPTLVVTGRQDSTVGYAAAWDLLEQYPRATFAVLDRAGHALPHEQPELLRALVTEWLDRVDEHAAAIG